MEKLVERVILLKNDYCDRLAAKHKYLSRSAWRFAGNSDYGLQILDEKRAVKEEYTLHTDKARITGYDIGIGTVRSTTKVKESVLEKILDQSDDHKKHPHLYTLKLIPTILRYVLKGDVGFGRKKSD